MSQRPKIGREDVDQIVQNVNEARGECGIDPVTAANLGFVRGRSPKHDVIVGLERYEVTPGQFALFHYMTQTPDNKAGTRYVRVDFSKTLTLIPIINGKILLLNRFRHGTKGLRWNLPRGWSMPELTTHEDRVHEMLVRRLGAATVNAMGSYAFEYLGDLDEDDAVRETPSDVYVVTAQMDESVLPKRHGDSQLRFKPWMEAVSLVRDQSSMGAFMRFISHKGLVQDLSALR